MKKRGLIQLPLYSVLIGLVIAFLIIIPLIYKTRSLVEGTMIEREYISKDIALLLDTIYASPGDIEYVYFLPKKAGITIKDNRVTVKDALTGLESSYYFATSNEFTEQEFETKVPPKAIRLLKEERTIRVQGIYDENERAAIVRFEEFVQFLKGNKDRHYSFRCREEFELRLDEGYYIVVTTKGNAALVYNEEIIAEIIRDKVPEFRHLETMRHADFFAYTGNWKPKTSIAIEKQFRDKIIIVNDEKTRDWFWAEPKIETNQLPQCESEELAGKRR